MIQYSILNFQIVIDTKFCVSTLFYETELQLALLQKSNIDIYQIRFSD